MTTEGRPGGGEGEEEIFDREPIATMLTEYLYKAFTAHLTRRSRKGCWRMIN